MANIVLGIGTSHSPLLNSPAEDYPKHAAIDASGRKLLDKNGKPCTYGELLEQADPSIKAQIEPKVLEERSNRCTENIARLARDMAEARLDALIVNSPEIERAWQATGKAGPPVHVVMNGVRLRVHERETLRRALRDEIGVAKSTILIGGAGHIAPRKGFDVLLRAFRDGQVDDAHLVIIGDGADRQRLELLAAELGIAARTSFLGHRDDGAAAIAGLDLFVLSSHNEGMANVMLEAMAGGTPVVAASISGVERALACTKERPPAGWIVPSVNPGDFADAICAAAGSIRDGSQEARAIAKEAEWRAVNWFGTERMVSECEAILFPGR